MVTFPAASAIPLSVANGSFGSLMCSTFNGSYQPVIPANWAFRLTVNGWKAPKPVNVKKSSESPVPGPRILLIVTSTVNPSQSEYPGSGAPGLIQMLSNSYGITSSFSVRDMSATMPPSGSCTVKLTL